MKTLVTSDSSARTAEAIKNSINILIESLNEARDFLMQHEQNGFPEDAIAVVQEWLESLPKVCSECNGSGLEKRTRDTWGPCYYCDGTGVEQEYEEPEVSLPVNDVPISYATDPLSKVIIDPATLRINFNDVFLFPDDDLDDWEGFYDPEWHKDRD